MALSGHLYIFQAPDTAGSSTGLSTSPWRHLPAELRIDIFERFLALNRTIWVDNIGENAVPSITPQEANALVTLCNTSREIRQQSLLYFFSNNLFIIHPEMKTREDANQTWIVTSAGVPAFHSFIDLVEPREITKMRIHMAIGSLVLPGLRDIWLLKSVLKTVASRKTESLRGECKVEFVVNASSARSLPPNRNRKFQIDAWNLPSALQPFCDALVEWLTEIDEKGEFRAETAQIKQVLSAWAKADWAARHVRCIIYLTASHHG